MAVQVMAFRTEDLPSCDRFPFWCDIVSETVSPVHARTDHPDDFRAQIRMVDLGLCQLSIMGFPSLDVYRTSRLVRRSDPEVYIVAVILRGEAEVTQDGHSVTLGPQEITVYDSSRPSRSLSRAGDEGHGAAAVLLIPREVLPMPPDRVRRLITRRLSARVGVGAIVLNHLTGLVRHAHEYSPPDSARLAATTVDLFAALLAHELDAEHCLPVETREQALLARVPDASVSSWIRRSRLERCRRDLLSAARRTEPVNVIAASWGFADRSHFSRAFRAEYGMSPTAIGSAWPVRRPTGVGDSPDVGTRAMRRPDRDQLAVQVGVIPAPLPVAWNPNSVDCPAAIRPL
ncbi:helix-turn-helix domain-containing protein [Plantactinospora solaniradicis]|uniref:Helix-turn-helix domain-containing protein n=1 Tax=Plantactinospora solaniradicis TaxID=1723736 RepID=A0ABW1K535_9ACTN